MSQEKYIDRDVHEATISAAVRNAQGKLLMESVLETKADTMVEFVQGVRGTLALAFEEGTWGPGYTIYASPMSAGWWFVIHARTLC